MDDRVEAGEMVVQEDGNGITADALLVKTHVKLVIRLSL